ncbi:MAG: helix-turn-helix domain-containing protein [Prochlorococcaceae cyanobacterium]
MARPGLQSLSRFPATLRAGLGRLWPRRSVAAGGGSPAATPVDPLLAAGQRLRQQRLQRQLSLRQLADETRISTAVLEALERGWRDRLPEPTYLRTMLPLIERHLELEPGSLEAVLPQGTTSSLRGRSGGGLLQRFTPGSIDVFTTWQGTVLYGMLTLGLIYGLNLQQQRLAAAGLLAVTPIPPRSTSPGDPRSGSAEGPAQATAEQTLLGAFPELRPLDQAAAGQALRLWREASSP